MNDSKPNHITIEKAFAHAWEKLMHHKRFFFMISLIENVLMASMQLAIFFLAKKISFAGSGGSSAVSINRITGAVTTIYSSPPLSAPQGSLIILLVGTIALFFILHGLISLGFIKIALQTYQNQPTSLRTLFSGGRMLLRYIAGSIGYFIAVLAGLIFFLVPGIYVAISYKFFAYAMVNHNLDIPEAFKQSRLITKDSMLVIFSAWIFFALCTAIIKAIPLFFIFNLLLVPFEYLVYAYFYTQLLEKNLPQIRHAGDITKNND